MTFWVLSYNMGAHWYPLLLSSMVLLFHTRQSCILLLYVEALSIHLEAPRFWSSLCYQLHP